MERGRLGREIGVAPAGAGWSWRHKRTNPRTHPHARTHTTYLRTRTISVSCVLHSAEIVRAVSAINVGVLFVQTGAAFIARHSDEGRTEAETLESRGRN